MTEIDVPILYVTVAPLEGQDRSVTRNIWSRLQDAAKDCGEFFSPPANPWNQWDRTPAGDGYFFRFDGLGPQVALKFADNLRLSLEKQETEIAVAGHRIRLRMALVLGDIETVEDQTLSEAYGEAKQLLSYRPIERRLQNGQAYSVSVMSNTFRTFLDQDEKRLDAVLQVTSPASQWSPFSFMTDTGQRQSGQILGDPLPKQALWQLPNTALAMFVLLNVFLFAASTFTASLFGIGLSTARLSADLQYKITAPNYPSTRRGDVSVVLMDDNSMRALGTRWPVPYGLHAAVLEELAALKPRAIMIDILFLDDRSDTDDSFTELVETLKKLGGEFNPEDRVPVYLATPSGSGDSPVLSELDKLTTRATISWNNKGPISQSPLYYPLSMSAGVNGKGFGAAYKIFRDICADGHPACAAGNVGRDLFKDPLQIYWGVVPPRPSRGQIDDCTRVAGNVLTRFWQWLTSTAAEFEQRCSYIRTVSADELLNGGGSAADAIKGRVVFYGAGFNGLSDVSNTPNHGPVYGVYLHAMALDNLLTFGANYKRWLRDDRPYKPFERIFQIKFFVDAILTVGLGLLLLGYFVLVRKFNLLLFSSKYNASIHTKKDLKSKISLYINYVILRLLMPFMLVVSVVVFANILLGITFDYGPIDWIAWIFLGLLVQPGALYFDEKILSD